MQLIGRKIYFDKATGNVLVDTGERAGAVIETTLEKDFESYQALKGRVQETVGCIRVPYGQDRDNFAKYRFHVDPTTEKIIWDLTPPQREEEHHKQTLEEKIAKLQTENVDLMLALTQVYEELLASKTGGAA